MRPYSGMDASFIGCLTSPWIAFPPTWGMRTCQQDMVMSGCSYELHKYPSGQESAANVISVNYVKARGVSNAFVQASLNCHSYCTDRLTSPDLSFFPIRLLLPSLIATLKATAPLLRYTFTVLTLSFGNATYDMFTAPREYLPS